ncbi:aa3-type cytochrome c oxidase subunit IV [Devosia sp. 1566]|nr:aa3-type cytochrome c oxidase subunit IV [Devosia sp. 1566]
MAAEDHPAHSHLHPPLQHESAMDYSQHESTYARFVTLVKWTTISIAAVIVLLYIFVRP